MSISNKKKIDYLYYPIIIFGHFWLNFKTPPDLAIWIYHYLGLIFGVPTECRKSSFIVHDKLEVYNSTR